MSLYWMRVVLKLYFSFKIKHIVMSYSKYLYSHVNSTRKASILLTLCDWNTEISNSNFNAKYYPYSAPTVRYFASPLDGQFQGGWKEWRMECYAIVDLKDGFTNSFSPVNPRHAQSSSWWHTIHAGIPIIWTLKIQKWVAISTAKRLGISLHHVLLVMSVQSWS